MPEEPTPTPPAPQSPETEGGDKGYPAETPLEQMTPAQQTAYWRAHAQKWQSRAKKFDGLTDEEFAALKDKASRHEALENELSSDKDKAVNAARAEERDAAAVRIARAEFKAAAKGVLTAEQLEALIEDLDLKKYVNAKGEPDEERITKKVSAFAPATSVRTGPSATGLGNARVRDDAPGAQGRAMAEKRFGVKAS